MFDWFHKDTCVLLLKILDLRKKYVCLSLLFQEKMWLIKRGSMSRAGFCNKKGLVKYIKIFI